MTYKHLTTRELTLIADFWNQGTKAYQAAKLLKRSQETVYRVYRFLNQGRATWYPNNNKDNPYRSSLSGFHSQKLNVTTDQARTLARLGKFSHAKLSAKALTNIDYRTGEISNGPVLATVSLFLKLNPEEVQQALRLKTSFELSNAINHK
jgi:soluble cytochrome b562